MTQISDIMDVDALSSSVFPLELLPREDVLFEQILPLVTPKDWLNLSRTCMKIYNILQSFFVTNKTLRIHQNQNIGPLEFRILTKYATNLRILDASGCSWMSDDLMRPVLKKNPKLNELNLSGSKNCSSIFKLLTADCHQLTRLVLRDCPWVDKNNYFSHFYTVFTEGTLLELDLTGCYKITDDNIETLTGVSINLQVLKLGSIPCSLTDNAMMAIANNLKQLCSLDISFSSVRISTTAIRMVHQSCSKLKTTETANHLFKVEREGVLSVISRHHKKPYPPDQDRRSWHGIKIGHRLGGIHLEFFLSN